MRYEIRYEAEFIKKSIEYRIWHRMTDEKFFMLKIWTNTEKVSSTVLTMVPSGNIITRFCVDFQLCVLKFHPELCSKFSLNNDRSHYCPSQRRIQTWHSCISSLGRALITGDTYSFIYFEPRFINKDGVGCSIISWVLYTCTCRWL